MLFLFIPTLSYIGDADVILISITKTELVAWTESEPELIES